MATRTLVAWCLGATLGAGCSISQPLAHRATARPSTGSLDEMSPAEATPGLAFRSSYADEAPPAARFFAVDAEEDTTRPPPTERKLIYTGRLRMAVADRVEAGKAAATMTESLDGYVHVLSDESVTLRVPVDRWEEALERVKEIGRVVSREFRAQDVTEEFLDIGLQLKNLRTLSERLSELLAKAETVEAALKVEKELARVRSDIERLEGRLKYLENHIAFATLTIEFVQIAEADPPSTRLPFDWLGQLGVDRLLGLPGGAR